MRSEHESASDEELAGQAQVGSLTAFEELVFRYERRIYAFVLQFCHNPADASELTQDTFVKAFQALAQFDVRQDFAAWLFTIARRKCIDHYRAAPPRADAPLPELADATDPSELLSQREAEQNLWQAARRVLPDLQFQALWFKYAEEMDVTQVARVLRKTRTYVKVLLFRARQTLVRELGKAGAHLDTSLGRSAPVSGAAMPKRTKGYDNPGPLGTAAEDGRAPGGVAQPGLSLASRKGSL